MKYKYYFKKPRSEIAKDILKAVALAGLIALAMTSAPSINSIWRASRKWRQHPRRKFYDAFYNLKRRGFLVMERDGFDLKISLTPKGKRAAGWLQIDALKISKPQKWDGKWRLIIFDIAELKRSHRNAFRTKLKELGFRYIQRSVWAHPYECRDEVELLKDFFGLKDGSILMLTALRIDNESNLKKLFHL